MLEVVAAGRPRDPDPIGLRVSSTTVGAAISAFAASRKSAVYWRGSTCATETPSWSVLPPLAQSAFGVAIRAVQVFVPAAVALAVISKRTQLFELVAAPKMPGAARSAAGRSSCRS